MLSSPSSFLTLPVVLVDFGRHLARAMDCERVESAEKRRGDFLRVVPFVFRCGVVKNVVFQSTYLCSLLLYKNPLLFLEEEEETTGREHVHTQWTWKRNANDSYSLSNGYPRITNRARLALYLATTRCKTNLRR